jgi:hypothetical protein
MAKKLVAIKLKLGSIPSQEQSLQNGIIEREIAGLLYKLKLTRKLNQRRDPFY